MSTLCAEFVRQSAQFNPSALPDPGTERIYAIQWVVASKRPVRIDGFLIEPAIASAILATYRGLSPENQAKYRNVPAGRMGFIAVNQPVFQAAA